MVEKLLSEAAMLFPSERFHVGGDEVDTRCWTETPRVAEWLKKMNFTADEAYGYFEQRVDALVRKQGRRSIVWEEVFVHHAATLPKDTLVQIWLGDGEGLKNVVHTGFDAIVSNYKHWYLPQLWETWDYYYGNDLWAWERTVT